MNETRPLLAGYRSVLVAEPWGDSGWKAGVLLQADEPRGTRAVKSLDHRIFGSQQAALDFARSEFGDLGEDR